uniref:DDE_3 domain-containing protein n=1 Tax=Steinernema glaseri TaxID=37863 RepID=A0A1I8AW78_9BILA
MARPSKKKRSRQGNAVRMWKLVRAAAVLKDSESVQTEHNASDVEVQTEHDSDQVTERMRQEIIRLEEMVRWRDCKIQDLDHHITRLKLDNEALRQDLLARHSVVLPSPVPPVCGTLCAKAKTVLSSASTQIETLVNNNIHLEWGHSADIPQLLTGISKKTLAHCKSMDVRLKGNDSGQLYRMLPKCRRAGYQTSRRERTLRAMTSVEESVLVEIRSKIDCLHRSGTQVTVKKLVELLQNIGVSFRTRKLTDVLYGLGYRGQRAIITHCLGPEGMLEGALDIFVSRNRIRSEDYHSDMNSTKFETWFQRLCRIVGGEMERTGRPATIIMDNASYHKRRPHRIPRSRDTRAEIHSWCCANGISGTHPGMRKADLLRAVAMAVSGHERYYQTTRTEEIAEEYGINIVFLPPYHSRLNPIELTWALMKDSITSEM